MIRGHANVNWIEYHPDGLGITVLMPNEPTRDESQRAPSPAGDVTVHSFTSEVPGQGIAGFAYLDYPGDLGDTSLSLWRTG
jgi:hypothetical protein